MLTKKMKIAQFRIHDNHFTRKITKSVNVAALHSICTVYYTPAPAGSKAHEGQWEGKGQANQDNHSYQSRRACKLASLPASYYGAGGMRGAGGMTAEELRL